MSAHPDPAGLSTAVVSGRLDISRLDVNGSITIPPSPSSPALGSPRDARMQMPSPRLRKSSPSLLRRTSSSLSLDQKAASPSLIHRASSNSLRNGDGAQSPRLTTRRVVSITQTSGTVPEPQAPEIHTANNIASSHFAQDLANHIDELPTTNAVVILQDACYSHRFARPSSKRIAEQNLEYTFERPERIEATALGVSAAYVLLGGRHADGAHAPHPNRLPPSQPPFRIKKTSRAIPLQSSFVTAVHGTPWMTELQEMCHVASARLPVGKELERIQNASAGHGEKQALHAGDLYLCPESLQALEGALGGVCDGVDAVFKDSGIGTSPHRAYVSIRPPGHHCAAHMPSGFCWLNNVHVGIEYASRTYGLTHAAIFDFDLHHGDGSQAIAWERNAKAIQAMQPSANARDQALKPRNYVDHTAIGYYSIHDIESYPCESGDAEMIRNASICLDNRHGQSIWNVHLESWQTPEEFWNIYESRYMVLLEKMRAFLSSHTFEISQQAQDQHSTVPKKSDKSRSKAAPKPIAAIFISAGFDASEHENPFMQRHGKKVMTEFYARVTQDIVKLAQEVGTAAEGRVISILEGGYSDKALFSGVLSHLCGLCSAAQDRATDSLTPAKLDHGLGLNLSDQFTSLQLHGSSQDSSYDVTWWEPQRLLAMEHILHPPGLEPTPPQDSRKTKLGGFSDPTHASTAKAVDPAKIYRHTSWSNNRGSNANSSQLTTPHIPEVDWVTATQELYKLLVPSDRQTKSHTADELVLNSVTRKPRHTTIGVPVTTAQGERQLRDRSRVKFPATSTARTEETSSKSTERSVSRSDRRKTIADLPVKVERPEEEAGHKNVRRSSIASVLSTVSATPSAVPAAQTPSKAPKTSNGAIQVRKARRSSPPSTLIVPAPLPTTATRPDELGLPPAGNIKPGDPDSVLDDITSGLRRVKITVPTDEEYAARHAKKAADQVNMRPATRPINVRPAARQPSVDRKSVAPKRVVVKGTTTSKSRPAPGRTTSMTPQLSVPSSATSPPQVPASNDVYSESHTHTDINTAKPIHPSVPALQFQHEYPTNAPPIPFRNDQPLQWQPTNSDVPQAPTSKSSPGPMLPALIGSVNDFTNKSQPAMPDYTNIPMRAIPTFSATGHIAFAPTAATSHQILEDAPADTIKPAAETQESDVWAVPTTPRNLDARLR